MTVTALADADGTLPFARAEATLSGAGERLSVGEAVTSRAVAEAFGGPGTLLLSLHGDFDEENPFASVISTADGILPLHQLVLGQTPIGVARVVLGVCESGRSRSSLVDEPIGFPAMLLAGGVTEVLAPAWRVDDFASFLYLSALFGGLREGRSLSAADRDASRWLREATAPQVLERLETLLARLDEQGETATETADRIRSRAEPNRSWLKSLGREEAPFRSPLDWAAFQLVGSAPGPVPGQGEPRDPERDDASE
jgi:CHAT domain-containing protein